MCFFFLLNFILCSPTIHLLAKLFLVTRYHHRFDPVLGCFQPFYEWIFCTRWPFTSPETFHYYFSNNFSYYNKHNGLHKMFNKVMKYIWHQLQRNEKKKPKNKDWSSFFGIKGNMYYKLTTSRWMKLFGCCRWLLSLVAVVGVIKAIREFMKMTKTTTASYFNG